MKYTPNKSLFKVQRFVSKGGGEGREKKTIELQKINLKLKDSFVILHLGKELSKIDLDKFSDSEKKLYLSSKEDPKQTTNNNK